MSILTREQMDSKYKWDIERMYPDENTWEKDLNKAISHAENFMSQAGNVGKDADSLFYQLEESSAISRCFENVFVYARQRRDEDNSNAKYIEMTSKAMSAAAKISSCTSFFTPELISCDEEKIFAFLDEIPGLKKYEFMLKSIFKEKKHILSTEEENIMANLGEIRGASSEIFSMLNDADLDFGKIKDSDGNIVHLTHGNYTKLMESSDREVRKNVFEQMYSKYKELNNTISVMYSYNVKNGVIGSRLRNYDGVLSAALDSENIPREVYTNLIDVIHEHLPSMYKYIEIRKRVLNLDSVKMYDVYTPLVTLKNNKCTFEEGVELCCKALKPLGSEYVNRFKKGVTKERWVDVYENKGKTSGAYSFGSYDSYPYILMNFNEDIKDVFTLIHEGGHSMHSIYTRENQPFIYGSHSIFTAETASTVNETLLINYLIDNSTEINDKIYWVNYYIDAFKSTVFRQTMFAEFELKVHEYVESGGQLTASWLNKTYDDLNTLYFGTSLGHDEYIQYEWSRIPHFYRPFYVYQYATGYSGANAIVSSILGKTKADRNDNGNYGKSAAKDYIEFLKTGDSNYPIELLKIAGIDMSLKNCTEKAMNTFDKLVEKLDELI